MPSASMGKKPSRSELAAAMASCRGAFVGVGLISGMVNILMLTGSFFMLQVYDRVIPSGSVPTLIGLSLLAGALFIFQGLLDGIRIRILSRIGGALDEALSGRVYSLLAQLPLKLGQGANAFPVARDLDQIRTYLSGLGPTAFFDLPWIPLYLGICFVFHPMIGILATAGATVLVTLALLTGWLSKAPTIAATDAATRRNILGEASRRNAEVLQAMGFASRLGARWGQANSAFSAAQQRTSDVSGGLGSTSKVLRMILQSAILGLGAWLVIHQQATAGIMIAGSIMMSRALAPVELTIANWKGFIGARQSWRRLGELFERMPPEAVQMALPAPEKTLAIESVSVSPPGGA